MRPKDQHDQCRHDDQLVGKRVKKLAEHRHHAPLTGQPAIDEIGHSSGTEDGRRPETRLPGIREHDDDDQGNGGNPGKGQRLGRLSRPVRRFIGRCRRCADTARGSGAPAAHTREFSV